MRYLLHLAFRGTDFVGWQVQPNGDSVQGTIEAALSTVLQSTTAVIGCGRTDSGVHASSFFAHFDAPGIPDNLSFKLNLLLPASIAIYKVYHVPPDFHARFDAVSRTYRYRIQAHKDPFSTDLVYQYPAFDQMDLDNLNRAAELIMRYHEFKPFCKSRSGVDHYRCTLTAVNWTMHRSQAELMISSNRFLRGMVRLVVGMSLYVATGKLTLEEVRRSLDEQTRLSRPWSAPAHGLYLSSVKYPNEFTS